MLEKICKIKTKNTKMKKSEKVFEVECIFKEYQSYYKVYWLGYNMTYDSWVTKKRLGKMN